MFGSKGLVKMYAPNGAEVYLPFDPTNANNMLALYEQQGLSPTPLNEYERERRSQVGAFVVRSHINPDGSETPVADVYFRHRNGYVDRLRSMRVYLNTERDVQQFQSAFGVRLDALAFWPGNTPPDRGRMKAEDEKKYIHRPRHRVWVVWRLNPASENDEQAPKRLFVRWQRGRTAGQAQPTTTTAQSNGSAPAQPATATAKNGGTAHPQPTGPQDQGDNAPQAQNDATPRFPLGHPDLVKAAAAILGVKPGEAARALFQAFPKGSMLTLAEVKTWAQQQA